jgi:hypothetical protein
MNDIVTERSDSVLHGKKVIVTGCQMPDGITIDVGAGHIYWTNMGSSPSANDGSIERSDIDGKNRQLIIPPGATFTPKQIHLDQANGKVYWSDREGMRVMRSNLNSSQIDTLVETGRGDVDRRDQTRWCVGIAIDPERKQIYWTQKGPTKGDRGAILRAGIEIPRGETGANRSDIEVFFDHLPEPIDLELVLKNRVLYWTNRGDPPRGNTVNRASIDAKPQAPVILVRHPDGGDRHRARCPARSHVCHGLCGIGLRRQTRWIRRAQFPLRAGQSHGNCIRRSLINTSEK